MTAKIKKYAMMNMVNQLTKQCTEAKNAQEKIFSRVVTMNVL